MKRILATALFATLAVAGIAFAQSVTNYLDVPNFAAATPFQIGGTNVTASAAELNYNDVTTAGTVQASKAVVVDSNKDASAFRNVGLVNLDAGSSGTAGTVDIFPSTASKGKIALTAADSAGDTTTTIVNASQSGARTYTIPDAGGSASFVMTEGAATVNGVKTFGSIPIFPTGGITLNATTLTETELGYLDGLTAGTVTASKGLVVDASKNLASLGIVTAGSYRKTNFTSSTAADVNVSKANLQGNGYFPADTTSNAVDFDIGDDAALDAADVGSEWIFMVATGHATQAITVTAGATGITTVTTLNAIGTTCEDTGDYIKCVARSTSAVTCMTVCAD